jgi:hypothetical protein
MLIKSHLCGLAVAYEPRSFRQSEDPAKKTGRPQGSHYSQQKKVIANATEWIRLNATYKPRIFVATSPGFTDLASEASLVSRLVHNLRNGYGCKNFVWVREFTGAGHPHFHFVADCDEFDPVRLSLYWSKQFGTQDKNSIRLGTAPKCPKCKAFINYPATHCPTHGLKAQRDFWIKNSRQCWYLTKYLGKSIGDHEKREKGKSIRTFAVSQEARRESEPLIYEGITRLNFTGLHSRTFELLPEMVEEGRQTTFCATEKYWHWTGHGQTYIGTPKSWGKRKPVSAPLTSDKG